MDIGLVEGEEAVERGYLGLLDQSQALGKTA